MDININNNDSNMNGIESNIMDLILNDHASSSSDEIENQESLSQLKSAIEVSLEELTKAAQILVDAKKSFERDSRLISESTAALERYWRQIHWHHGFIGMGVALILCGGAFSIFYMKSAERILAEANVRLTSEAGSKGARLTLSGEKIVASGRSDNQLVVEFSK